MFDSQATELWNLGAVRTAGLGARLDPRMAGIVDHMSLTQVGIYSSVAEANLVKARLEFSGIDAMIQADSASGAVPQLEAYSGVRVFVRSDDMAEALEILERMLPSDTGP